MESILGEWALETSGQLLREPLGIIPQRGGVDLRANRRPQFRSSMRLSMASTGASRGDSVMVFNAKQIQRRQTFGVVHQGEQEVWKGMVVYLCMFSR